MKHCACGVTYTREEWADLEYVGHGLGLEMRNCGACRSTICIESGRGEDDGRKTGERELRWTDPRSAWMDTPVVVEVEHRGLGAGWGRSWR